MVVKLTTRLGESVFRSCHNVLCCVSKLFSFKGRIQVSGCGQIDGKYPG